MYSLQYRSQMDHNEYEENEGAAAFSRRPLIFWIWGMVHLWPVLRAVHGLCMAHMSVLIAY